MPLALARLLSFTSIEAAGASLRHLSHYSPDFDPIEQATADETQGSTGGAVGVDTDQAAIFEPTDPPQAAVTLTSVEKKLGQSIYTALKETLSGTAPYGQTILLGLADGAVGISKNQEDAADLPGNVRKEIDDEESSIVKGDIKVESTIK